MGAAAVPAPDGQLDLEGMPTRLYSATPSRLAAWLDCPRRYRMTYLDRPAPAKGAPWAHNSLGASLHNALAAWWRLPVERRTPDAAALLVRQGWIADGFRDEEQSALWRARAEQMAADYVSELDPYDEPLGVERTVATKTATLALSGRIDRLDERPSTDGERELVVVDYKTGRHAPTADDARGSLALAVYAAAAARTLRQQCVKVELHHLPTASVVGHEYTEETLARQLGRAEAVGAEASAADTRYRAGLDAEAIDDVFPARPSRGCSWCDFRRHCVEGQAVSAQLASWDGLAEA